MVTEKQLRTKFSSREHKITRFRGKGFILGVNIQEKISKAQSVFYGILEIT